MKKIKKKAGKSILEAGKWWFNNKRQSSDIHE